LIKVGVIGASGYTGSELVRLLLSHPESEVSLITSESYQGKKMASLYPNLTGLSDLNFSSYQADEAKKVDVVFVALPHGTSMKVVPELLDGERKMIDLSGDFRLRGADDYKTWYKISHTASHLLGKAVYGLCEINRALIKKSNFVSNPGCYPTAAILGVAPLLHQGLLFGQDLIIDALTGVSGSGRSLSEKVHYCFCDENVSSYKVGGVHQHIPEMEQVMGKIAGEEVKVSFTPHLSPFSRGIYATIYGDLKEDISTPEALQLYRNYYKDSYFVKVLDEGLYPEVKAVAGSNFCHIGLKVDERCGRVIAISAIDNLVKGAGGQAIQNMNLMFGFPEETGLTQIGLYP
jgi:N-acetyl-gamma-glutamyl-phosphate reductase